MDTKHLTLEALEEKSSQNQARLAKLYAQENHRVIKENKRLQILIGVATLVELEELINSDPTAYRERQNQIKAMLDKYIHKQRDREFLSEFDFIENL